MRSVTAAEARSKLSELIAEAGYMNERIVVTKNGKGLAAFISIEDLNLLQALEDKLDTQESINALKDIRKNGSVSFEKLKRKRRP